MGLSGKDGGLLTAVEKDPALGRVGSITRVEPPYPQTLLDGDFLPVVSPIAAGTAAASTVPTTRPGRWRRPGADKLIFLTDTTAGCDNRNSKTAVPTWM